MDRVSATFMTQETEASVQNIENEFFNVNPYCLNFLILQLYRNFFELAQLTIEGDQNGKTSELIKGIKESNTEIDTLIDSLSSNLPKNVSIESIVPGKVLIVL